MQCLSSQKEIYIKKKLKKNSIGFTCWKCTHSEIIIGLASELQVKPLHVCSIGTHGSACQSSLEILDVCLMSMIAATVVYKK